VQLAKTVVGARLIAADIDPAKRAHAVKAGAEKAVDNRGDDAVKAMQDATGGGPAAAVDFVGSPETVKYSIDIVRRGGHVVIVGLFGGAISLSTMTFPSKLVTVTGSYVGTLDDLKDVIALAQAGKLAPIPVTSVPANKAGDALRDLKEGGKVIGRVVLVHD
jgi:D-arabinose 1-dehydrogenase-like Zn-dependent alcohol dehydrogenase